MVASVEPGQTVTLSVPDHSTLNGRLRTDMFYTRSGKTHRKQLSPIWTKYRTKVLQKPMTPRTFPELPIGKTAMAFREPTLWKHQQEDEELLENEKLSAFLDPTLDKPIPCFAVSGDAPTLTLCLMKTEVTFDLAQLQAVSLYFQKLTHFDSKTSSITVEMKRKTFDLLVTYLYHGDLDSYSNQRETDLIELYKAANYFGIERLESLCVKEIALRLKEFHWKNTGLFRPFKGKACPLGQLVALFDFTSSWLSL